MAPARPDWTAFRHAFTTCPESGLTLDTSRVGWDETWLLSQGAIVERALRAMRELEGGAIANPDEERRVGHYWLRAPRLAPDELRETIDATRERVTEFARRVHAGEVAPPSGSRFTHLLLVGIGGSALGPQLVSDALASHDDPLTVLFLDNTDPDGFHDVLAGLGEHLSNTLTVVVSKSGGTKETRNGMLAAMEAYRARGLAFAKHAVAVTGKDSQLDRLAREEGWIETFPIWDWVGGRTSLFSAVGLLPAALQGIDVVALLEGAAAMDRTTRAEDLRANPALLMSLAWFHAGKGRGERNLVVLPYRDRLLLLSRYLQQLVMESLGKAEDLDGKEVFQGLTVYGNKGSTDQHAFVQQLRDGRDDFLCVFVHASRNRVEDGFEVESGVTAGDYLNGFYLGTREALTARERPSLTLSLPVVDARSLGALIALFERAVGFYASLIHVNAYHQPGVEAGKKAATRILELQSRVLEKLRSSDVPLTAEECAAQIGAPEDTETVFHLLRHLAATGRAMAREGGDLFQSTYRAVGRPS